MKNLGKNMENLYEWKYPYWKELITLWQKEKLLIMCNFLFCHNVFTYRLLQGHQKASICGKGKSILCLIHWVIETLNIVLSKIVNIALIICMLGDGCCMICNATVYNNLTVNPLYIYILDMIQKASVNESISIKNSGKHGGKCRNCSL